MPRILTKTIATNGTIVQQLWMLLATTLFTKTRTITMHTTRMKEDIYITDIPNELFH